MLGTITAALLTLCAPATALNARCEWAAYCVVPAPRPSLEEWEQQVDQRHQKSRQLAQRLISLIQEEKAWSPKERQRAVFLLAKIGNKEALVFLVDHIDLCISIPNQALYEPERSRMDTCRHALIHYVGVHDNWQLAQVILKSLDSPKTEHQLTFLGATLHRAVGRELFPILLDRELSRQPEGARKKNLEQLKQWKF